MTNLEIQLHNARNNERHDNSQETLYWLRHYRHLATQAIEENAKLRRMITHIENLAEEFVSAAKELQEYNNA